MHDKGQVSRMEFRRASITFPAIAVVASAIVLLLLSNLPSFSQLAYSQTNNTYPGSQNLSSLLKNFLIPPKDVSGHYSNPQFGITDIVFPDGWHGREAAPNSWFNRNHASRERKWFIIRYHFVNTTSHDITSVK